MNTYTRVRPPAVAGRFYPEHARTLEKAVRGFLDDAAALLASSPDLLGHAGTSSPPVALVAPHAGYVYSGPVAGSAWASARPSAAAFRRVALFGPSHHVAFHGLALPGCDAFATPLGEHRLDAEGVATLSASVAARDRAHAHAREHSLEVHLPFIRVALGDLPLVPVLTGEAAVEDVADAMELLWTPDTLLAVSSDLSHYLPYAAARDMDLETARIVEKLRVDALTPERACGAVALRGLMEFARRRGLQARCLDLRNSGDTAPDPGGLPSRVVGYGAFGFWPQKEG